MMPQPRRGVSFAVLRRCVTMIPKPLATRVVKLSRRFAALELWRDLADDMPFALELPGEPHLCYGELLGGDGLAFGLALYRGEHALEQLRNIARGDDQPRVAVTLILTFEAPGSVRPELLELARTAGCNERIQPAVLVVDERQPPRAPRTSELRFLATALEAVLLADEGDLLPHHHFAPLLGGSIATLSVDGLLDNGRVRSVSQRWVDVPAPAGVAATDGGLPWPLDELPVLDGHWVVSVERMAAHLVSNDQPLRRLLVIDPERDYVVALQALADDGEAAAALARAIDGAPEDSPWRQAIARHIAFTDAALFDTLAPAFAARGVTVTRSDGHPLLERIGHELHAHLQTVAAAEAAIEEPELPPATAMAEELRSRIGARLGVALDKVDVYSRKAQEQFFGDAELLDALEAEAGADEWIDEPDDLADHTTPAQRTALLADAAYRQWYALCYRSKRGRRTVAESLLAGALPLDECHLLEALVSARPGLFRVVEVQAPRVVLADTLSDYQVELIAPRLAVGLDQSLLLAGRIVDYPGAAFFEMWGAPITVELQELVAAAFEEQFGALTHERLLAEPGLLGRLWTVMAKLDADA